MGVQTGKLVLATASVCADMSFILHQAVTPTEKSYRPSHRASMHGAILHDASYFGLLELKGLQEVLKLILDSCCDAQMASPGAQR